MAKFVYNNIKNIKINYIFFELNFNYYLDIFYSKNINLYYKYKSINNLANNLIKYMILYYKNFQYAPNLQN